LIIKAETINHKAYSSVPLRLTPYFFHEQVREVQIIDKRGGNRSVGVRYCASYPVENNDWGEFQVSLFLNLRASLICIIEKRIFKYF
jgi:hypothetical protein